MIKSFTSQPVEPSELWSQRETAPLASGIAYTKMLQKRAGSLRRMSSVCSREYGESLHTYERHGELALATEQTIRQTN